MEGVTELENHFITSMKQYIHTSVINAFTRKQLTGSFAMEALGCYHFRRHNNGTPHSPHSIQNVHILSPRACECYFTWQNKF